MKIPLKGPNHAYHGFTVTIIPKAIERERESTGISSHLGAKLRDWAERQAEAAATHGQLCL